MMPTRLMRDAARSVYRATLGFAPFYRPIHPHWADVQPILKALSVRRAARILHVVSRRLSAHRFARIATASIATDELLGSSDASAASLPEEGFDVCILELDRRDFVFRSRRLLARVLPSIAADGRIFIYYEGDPSADPMLLPEMIDRNVLGYDMENAIVFAGSRWSLDASARFDGAIADLRTRSPRRMVSGLLKVSRAAVSAWSENRRADIVRSGRERGVCTSMTLELVPKGYRMPASVVEDENDPVDLAVVAAAAGDDVGGALVRDLVADKEELQKQIDVLELQKAALKERVEHLEGHVNALTDSAIAQARKLKENKDVDYQILMGHQQMLAGLTDADPAFAEIYERCRPFTMTAIERLYMLFKSVEYIVANRIPGSIVETGVWRGGSCMLVALALRHFGDTTRRIVLFDTFAGHPRPDAERDVDLWGNAAVRDWSEAQKADGTTEWGFASLDEVRANLLSTGYPADNLTFVKGDVEQTLAQYESGSIALLRLDTDWYASTRASLERLYPALMPGGILIVDDYGHYKGQRQAVDEYFAQIGERPLLSRIDYSCRLAVKSAATVGK